MDKRIIARWQDWSGTGIEHAVIREARDLISAESVILAGEAPQPFAAHYRLEIDSSWSVKSADISVVGDGRRLVLTHDGDGSWSDGSGSLLPELQNARDIDLSVTPFTNTIPIRRLGLAAGESRKILAVYVRLPEFTVATDPQRYTCLEPMRRYRYESLDSDFVREIEVDSDGLVLSYPGLFRRLA